MFSKIKSEKFNQEHFISLGILLLLFLYMLALNFMMPLHRDDYEYSLIWGTSEKILSFPDVFQSLYNHYLVHGGRMISFFVLDSLLLFGKEWFNPLNAFLFVALIILIYWHSRKEITYRFNPYLLLIIIFFCWLGFPHFALVNIWMTGACVYLLTAVLIFAFLLPYNFALWQKPLFRDSYPMILCMFLAGIISGWTIENTAATMNLIIAGIIFYTYKKRNLTKWMISGFCGSALGFFFLVIAPGNYVRSKEIKHSLIYNFANQFAAGAEMLIYILPIILFLVLAWRILVKEHVKSNGVMTNCYGRYSIPSLSSILMGAFILFLLTSYLNGSFFAKFLSSFIYDNLAVPLGIVKEKFKIQLFNTISGVEEFGSYLLLMALVYNHMCKNFSLRKADLKDIKHMVNWRELISANPACSYAAAIIGLALINNLVMLASPYFPVRACFGSVVFLIIGAVSLFSIPRIYSFFLIEQKKYILSLILIVLIPMTSAVLYQYYTLYKENTIRMAYVEAKVKEGATYLELEPLSIKNRILRHVYFVELNNPVSKHGFRIYYGLKDVKVKQQN